MTTANSSRTELTFIPRASIPHCRVMRTQDKQGVDTFLTETKSQVYSHHRLVFLERMRRGTRDGWVSTPAPCAGRKSMRGLFNIHAAESSAGGNHSRPWHLAMAKALRTSWT